MIVENIYWCNSLFYFRGDIHHKKIMCDCEISTDFSNEQKRLAVVNEFAKLTPLKFSNYEKYGHHKKLAENSVYLSYFDKNKLSIKRNQLNEANYDILYDDEPFRIALKSLSGVVKESKYFDDEKNIKVIRNPFSSKQLCSVFHAIKELVRNDQGQNNCWFLDCYKVIIDSDTELLSRCLYYFKDAITAFDQVIQRDNDSWAKDYRIICNLIESKVKLVKCVRLTLYYKPFQSEKINI